jgi:hypothetical protein
MADGPWYEAPVDENLNVPSAEMPTSPYRAMPAATPSERFGMWLEGADPATEKALDATYSNDRTYERGRRVRYQRRRKLAMNATALLVVIALIATAIGVAVGWAVWGRGSTTKKNATSPRY